MYCKICKSLRANCVGLCDGCPYCGSDQSYNTAGDMKAEERADQGC